MKVLNSQIHKRTAYGEAVLSGTIVHNLKKKSNEAVNEIEELTNEIIKVLNTSAIEG